MKTMATAAAIEAFNNIDVYVEHSSGVPKQQPVFMLPRWMQAWRNVFSPDDQLHICVMKERGKSIGVAPLSIKGTTASFVGDPEICDCMDLAVVPGYEKQFYHALLDELAQSGVADLDLRCLRPESTVFSHLAESALDRWGMCSFEPDGVSVEMDLPRDWDQYLASLDGKQRHEIRRKFRRLYNEGEINFVVLENPAEIEREVDPFLKMFRESRSDKALFMSSKMETFFRSMTKAMSEEALIRLFILKVNEASVAACLCFDCQNTMYLYNSGYDTRYSSLSIGLLCKILSIKHSIEIGRKKYDFLKGAEPYKYHLGGREVRLSRCRISFR
ncbi:MAG: GNAT family N-acetyltransferase [Candidatus Abyssobacteria bacterium SURF_5]|uniref:GNAT family N-acetyltransferase n=1 Tax=Abyssobacteria bacterium (strain SURF_5) TaxID=2093360 RepID=A0A3A4NN07_ABYX5|nr:MAG: GNAT family N-acetyltransferase [Candidatus Abyssubacteria bacterium SURF_5]